MGHQSGRYYDREMAESGSVNFLSYFIYLTRGWDTNLVCIIPGLTFYNINHDLVAESTLRTLKMQGCLNVDKVL